MLAFNNLVGSLSGIVGKASCYYTDSQYIKENGQTADSSNVSALAPPSEELLNIWWDFRKVAEFIDINRGWLLPLLLRLTSEKLQEATT